MAGFEYKVVPAPTRGVKAKGVRTAEDRFAHTLQSLMNDLGAEGWEYQRADTLPATERAGLTGSQTVWRHVLVFRRAAEPVAATEPSAPAAEPLKLEDKTKAPAAPASVAVAAAAPTDSAPDPDDAAPQAQDTVETADETTAETAGETTDNTTDDDAAHPAGQPGATRMLRDNGVEETSDVSGPSASLNALAKGRKKPSGSNP